MARIKIFDKDKNAWVYADKSLAHIPIKDVDYFDGKDGISATHSWNDTTLTITSASGTSSVDLKGADGVSPTVAVSKSGKVTTLSISDKNGTKTATINDGSDGASVSVKSVSESSVDSGNNVVTFSDGKTVTVKNGSSGKTPVKGTDYFTAADKSDMVAQVKNVMPTLTVIGVDEDGVSHTWFMYGVSQ